jgi:hypothetical protein
MATSSQLHAQAALSTIKFTRFPSNRRFFGSQNRCERFGARNKSRAFAHNWTLIPQTPSLQPTQYADCARPAPLLLCIIIICTYCDQAESFSGVDAWGLKTWRLSNCQSYYQRGACGGEQSCCVRVEDYWSVLYNKHQITCFSHDDVCYKDTVILVAQSGWNTF